MNKNEVVDLIRKNIDTIKRYGIKKIGLFGSIVRSDNSPESDIDILISFVPGKKTFDNYMDLKFFLEDILKCTKIDLVIEENIKERLKSYIYRDIEYVA
ncbi:MAG: nucleotidyltransferase family protein [Spirochaetales bacterium]|nr:nucleotidyltransferase family protein [Spirochaetales bacterium]